MKREHNTMDMKYEVRYLLNGDERTIHVEATSAAAASEAVRNQVSGDNEDFELIQVQLVEESPEEVQPA